MNDRNEKNARERMEIIRGLVSRQSIDSKGAAGLGDAWKQRCATQLCGLALAEIAELFRYQVSGSLRDVPDYLIHREAIERFMLPSEEDTESGGD